MNENARERQYEFTVTLPPHKLRKPPSPETKRALKKFGEAFFIAVCGGIGLAIGWFMVIPAIHEIMKIFS